jgi:hypothetical protein
MSVAREGRQSEVENRYHALALPKREPIKIGHRTVQPMTLRMQNHGHWAMIPRSNVCPAALPQNIKADLIKVLIECLVRM